MIRRERRMLVLGGAVVTVAVFVLHLGPWTIQSIRSLERSVSAESDLLARARRVMGRRGVLADSIALLEQRIHLLAPSMLGGPSRTAAVTDLVGRVTVAATRHNVTLGPVAVVADSVVVGRLSRVKVTVPFESDLPNTLHVLRELERDTALMVSALHVRRVTEPASEGASVLSVEVEVAAWSTSTASPESNDESAPGDTGVTWDRAVAAGERGRGREPI